jgi:ribonucleotide reductase class II
MPFEPIEKLEYLQAMAEVQQRRMNDDFDAALKSHDGTTLIEAGPAPCDSDYCLRSSSEVEAKPFSETSMFAPIK